MNDNINRQDAIRDIRSMDVCVMYDDTCSTEEAVEKAIVTTKSNAIFGLECMPSVEPRKKGKWINSRDVSWLCSECGKWLDVLQGDVDMNFCPNCGADMREPFTIPTEIIESVIGYDD